MGADVAVVAAGGDGATPAQVAAAAAAAAVEAEGAATVEGTQRCMDSLLLDAAVER